MKNYYTTLNLTSSASQAEIKKAYRALAVQYHPDKNNGDSSSEERFKEISEAYIVLGDVAKRNAYDFAKGYQTSFRANDTNASGQTPATFLLLFKKVKNRVLNAGGRVKQEALFKVIDDLLSDETIKFLITCGDTATNSIIIDDILTSAIFLDDADRATIYTKLFKLAEGNNWLLSKVARLKETSLVGTRRNEINEAEQPSTISIVLFVVFVLILVMLIIK